MGLPNKLLLLFVVTSFVASCASSVHQHGAGDSAIWSDGSHSSILESNIDTVASMDKSLNHDVDDDAVDKALEDLGVMEVTNVEESTTKQTKVDLAVQPLTQPLENSSSTEASTEIFTPLKEKTVQVAPTAPSIEVKNVVLNEENNGKVKVVLSEESAFVLVRESNNEYILQLPGATIASGFPITQITTPGRAAIRSARVISDENGAQVRMFVDETISLVATPNGNNLDIKVVEEEVVQSFRAQLAESEAKGEDIISATSLVKKKEKRKSKGRQSSSSEFHKKQYTGRLISLDLQDADIDNALRIIAEVSQLNIIASEGVRGQVTLRLIDVPWDQALDVILKTHGLDQVRENNVIRIAPIETLRAEREALLEAKRAAENLEDLQVRYIRVSYSRAEEVQPLVEGILSERGSVEADPRTNQLIIKDVESGVSAASQLVKKLDLRTPQILLETQIVEATRDFSRKLGFEWSYNFSRGPQYGNATGHNFPYAYDVTSSSNFAADGVTKDLGVFMGGVFTSANGAKSLNATISALEQDGLAEIISRPQVATVNNKEANIKSVETIRVPTTSNTTTVATGEGNTVGSQSNAFEEFDVGIELKVTPQASPDYYVLMDIFAKSSTLSGSTFGGIPSTFEREATSTVLVESGQTFVLGGVYRINDRDSIRGIPWLKDIPFIGYLFRSTSTEKKNEELIFFITPHIVEGSFDSGLM